MDIPFLSDILAWMQSLWDFLYSGVYDFVTDAFVLLTKMAIKGWFEMQLFVAEI
ncbi:TPA: hypothetical protein L3911_005843, partial [Pseudomonas aeruginosa]|nr:hypothetical protein [Pseudomonas aeruginosa]HCE9787076.1 hypothetical protein [Pseudomonas aeruginosa]